MEVMKCRCPIWLQIEASFIMIGGSNNDFGLS